MKASRNYGITRPDYLALDGTGMEYTRKARTIGELPVDHRGAALESATETIGHDYGIKMKGPIRFGSPMFKAAGMTLQQAKNRRLPLLLLKGEDVPLDKCRCYEAEHEAVAA